MASPSRVRAAAVLQPATHLNQTNSIQQFRTAMRVVDDSVSAWSRPQLRDLMTGLAQHESLVNIAESVKKDLTVVADEIVSFGGWLARRYGPANVTFVSPKQMRQIPLFEMPTEKKPEVEVDESLLPRNLGRNVKKSLGAVLMHSPETSDETLNEYDAWRTSRFGTATVSLETVCGVAYFARHGRLTELVNLPTEKPLFRLAVIDSYDLLDVGRMESVAALQTLLLGEHTDDDWQRLVDVAANLYNDTHQVADANTVPHLYDRELDRMARRVIAAGPVYAPRDVASLSIAQVIRIARYAHVDGTSPDDDTPDDADDLVDDEFALFALEPNP